MRVVVQRCKNASVKVNNQIVGKINHGLVLLVGFTQEDDINKIDYMVDKIINLRIFDDDTGIMNKSVLDVGGQILSVSQFTLYADCAKGRRPSYIKALNSKDARVLYDKFNEQLIKQNIKVETGLFGADMQLELINDGPITILLERN